jgi:transcriptional regulator of arginine metabolism
MQMQKNHRLSIIQQLINQKRISTQEELLHMLEQEGFHVTQATLSRDLKHLNVARIPDKELGNVYILPEQLIRLNNKEEEKLDLPISGFISLQFSNNLAVIRTVPAFSHSIALGIDKADLYEILGTIAGNDTVLIILREGVTQQDFKNALLLKFPELESKIS